MALVAIFSTPYNPKKSCFRCSFKFSPPFQASDGTGGNIFNTIQPQKVCVFLRSVFSNWSCYSTPLTLQGRQKSSCVKCIVMNGVFTLANRQGRRTHTSDRELNETHSFWKCLRIRRSTDWAMQPTVCLKERKSRRLLRPEPTAIMWAWLGHSNPGVFTSRRGSLVLPVILQGVRGRRQNFL